MNKLDQMNENNLLRVQKRGYKVEGPEESLQMFARDDTGEIFAKITRHDFERIGREISERGGVGKCLYALKGRLWDTGEFVMLWVSRARYIGDLG